MCMRTRLCTRAFKMPWFIGAPRCGASGLRNSTKWALTHVNMQCTGIRALFRSSSFWYRQTHPKIFLQLLRVPRPPQRSAKWKKSKRLSRGHCLWEREREVPCRLQVDCVAGSERELIQFGAGCHRWQEPQPNIRRCKPTRHKIAVLDFEAPTTPFISGPGLGA